MPSGQRSARTGHHPVYRNEADDGPQRTLLQRSADAARKTPAGVPRYHHCAISTQELEDFLSGMKVGAETRNTHRRDMRTLWNFAEKRGWALGVTATNTERVKAIEKPPGILRPEQVAALLSESNDSDLLALHAIGCFAGLRVAEINALDWKDVDLAHGFINVGAKISKTRSRRLVPILDNLRAWLQPIARPSGPVLQDPETRYRRKGARRRAGITVWRQNCMRHSFVSYRLASTQNAPQTALESGHDQAILFAHYRELVRPKDAERFFSIRPAAASEKKIVSISAARAALSRRTPL
jgi:integrase